MSKDFFIHYCEEKGLKCMSFSLGGTNIFWGQGNKYTLAFSSDTNMNVGYISTRDRG